MKKNWRRLVGAAAVLLLAGAGCGARTDTGAKIDATVDGIEGDRAAEQAELNAEEQDSAEVDSDKTEINAYGDATYEIK